MKTKEYMSVKEAAAYLGIGTRKMWSLVQENENKQVPTVRLGKRRIVRKEDLDKFMEENLS